MGIIRLRGVSLVALAGLALAAATPAWADGTVSGSAFGVSVNATVAGIHVTAGPTPTVTLPLGLPWLGARFRLDMLAAFFLVVVNLGSAAACLFAIGYGRHEAQPEAVIREMDG